MVYLSPPQKSKLKMISQESLYHVWNGHTQSLTESEQDLHLEAVRNILVTNFSRGRLQYAVGKSREATEVPEPELKDYGRRVAKHYWVEHARVAGLEAGEREHWQALRELLRVYTQHILRKRTDLCYVRCRELAEEYAQEACHQIFEARYPFDVPFEAWSKRIALNCILKRQQRSRDLLDQGTFIQTDVESPILSLFVDLSFSEYNPFEYVDWRLILLDAIEQLSSEAQRRVILLGFFYGWSDEDLSKDLDRSRQAVYNLRDRALKALHSILSFNDKTLETGCEQR